MVVELDSELKIPVSAVAEVLYCPRNFYYRVVEGAEDTNAHVLQGKLEEERRNSRKSLSRTDYRQSRGLFLTSDYLPLTGVVDVVEEKDDQIWFCHHPGGPDHHPDGDCTGTLETSAARAVAWRPGVCRRRPNSCGVPARLPSGPAGHQPGADHVDTPGAYLRKRQERLLVTKDNDIVKKFPCSIEQVIIIGTNMSTQLTRLFLKRGYRSFIFPVPGGYWAGSTQPGERMYPCAWPSTGLVMMKPFAWNWLKQ